MFLFAINFSNQFSMDRRTLRGIGTVLVLIIDVKRDYRVLLAKGPPPAEARQSGEHKAGVVLPPETLDEVQYRVQRLFRAPIVRTDADIAAEFQHRCFLARIEGGFFENHHPLGFAEDVVVEGALRDAILGGCLGEAHFLSHHGLDRFLEIMSRPRGRLQLQQGRIVSQKIVSGFFSTFQPRFSSFNFSR